jgi:hypothetical protein
MSIINQLSSQVGDRTEESNRRTAARCLAEPALIAEVAEGLKHQDPALVGDCAEVLTKVAEQRPEWIAPYAEQLAGLLAHDKTRVRWEAMHALALVTHLVPQVIGAMLHRLAHIIRTDRSVIVRDSAVDAVGHYAGTSVGAAEAAYPILKEALSLWDEKQAARSLRGLCNVAARLPGLADELHSLGQSRLDHARGVVRKAARSLVQATEGK